MSVIDITTGLVLRLTLNDITNGQVIDKSRAGGEAYNISGYPETVSDDLFGDCVNFDGINDYVNLGNPSDLQITGDQTIGMWINPANFDNGQNPYSKNYSAEGAITLWTGSAAGKFYYFFRPVDAPGYLTFKSESAVPLNQWTHIAAVRDFQSHKVFWYINGVRDTELDIPVSYAETLSSSSSAYIGHGYTGTKFQGQIAHFRMYNRALSEAEIKKTMELDQSGLVLRLSLDEISSDQTVEDISGNYQVCSVSGDPEIVHDDIFGACMSFDGVDDYISIASPSGVPSGNSRYAISAWIKANSMKAGGIAGWGNYGSVNQVNAFRLTDSGLINYWWGNDLAADVSLAGQWRHVVATFDGAERKIYVDGIVIGSDAATGHNVPNANNFRIGSTNNGEYFDGKIAHVRIYNKALSVAEIKKTMELDQSGLVLRLPLDEISSDQTVADISGNNHVCTVHGDPEIIPDDIFGSCMSFDETDSVYVASISGLSAGNTSHTIEAWVCVDKLPSYRSWPLLLGTAAPGACHWLIHSNGVSRFCVWGGPELERPTLKVGEWTHIATVYNGSALSLYINGSLFSSEDYDSLNLNVDSLSLGYQQNDGFAGKIANVRVYRRALSEAGIRRAMLDDQTAQSAFKTAYPMDFKLIDDEELNVFYISDGENLNNFNAEIENDSDMNINISSIIQNDIKVTKAGVDNHHLSPLRKVQISKNQANLGVS